jgi:hypothetical protein
MDLYILYRGIQKSENCSAMTTVTENIRKARRGLYSLMGTGLHGENGLDHETAMSTGGI